MVSEAYKILGNPKLREEYDLQRFEGGRIQIEEESRVTYSANWHRGRQRIAEALAPTHPGEAFDIIKECAERLPEEGGKEAHAESRRIAFEHFQGVHLIEAITLLNANCPEGGKKIDAAEHAMLYDHLDRIGSDDRSLSVVDEHGTLDADAQKFQKFLRMKDLAAHLPSDKPVPAHGRLKERAYREFRENPEMLIGLVRVLEEKCPENGARVSLQEHETLSDKASSLNYDFPEAVADLSYCMPREHRVKISKKLCAMIDERQRDSSNTKFSLSQHKLSKMAKALYFNCPAEAFSDFLKTLNYLDTPSLSSFIQNAADNGFRSAHDVADHKTFKELSLKRLTGRELVSTMCSLERRRLLKSEGMNQDDHKRIIDEIANLSGRELTDSVNDLLNAFPVAGKGPIHKDLREVTRDKLAGHKFETSLISLAGKLGELPTDAAREGHADLIDMVRAKAAQGKCDESNIRKMLIALSRHRQTENIQGYRNILSTAFESLKGEELVRTVAEIDKRRPKKPNEEVFLNAEQRQAVFDNVPKGAHDDIGPSLEKAFGISTEKGEGGVKVFSRRLEFVLANFQGGQLNTALCALGDVLPKGDDNETIEAHKKLRAAAYENLSGHALLDTIAYLNGDRIRPQNSERVTSKEHAELYRHVERSTYDKRKESYKLLVDCLPAGDWECEQSLKEKMKNDFAKAPNYQAYLLNYIERKRPKLLLATAPQVAAQDPNDAGPASPKRKRGSLDGGSSGAASPSKREHLNDSSIAREEASVSINWAEIDDLLSFAPAPSSAHEGMKSENSDREIDELLGFSSLAPEEASRSGNAYESHFAYPMDEFFDFRQSTPETTSPHPGYNVQAASGASPQGNVRAQKSSPRSSPGR